jgi:hypothetical protein
MINTPAAIFMLFPPNLGSRFTPGEPGCRAVSISYPKTVGIATLGAIVAGP